MPEFQVVRGGSASALKLLLRRGEQVKAESDALVSKTNGVQLAAGTDGGGSFISGLLGGAARSMLTGESFFLQTLTCESDSGEAIVAPSEQGDIAVLKLGEVGAVYITSGAYLCSEACVEVATRVQGIANGLLSGSGFFLMRCSGRGNLAVACLGSCMNFDLSAGEARQVDNGHLVAWSEKVNCQVGMASTGIFNTFASGEGLMCTMTGPGSVWLQTHKPPPVEKGGKKRNDDNPLAFLAGLSNLTNLSRAPFAACAMGCLVFFIAIVVICAILFAVLMDNSGGSSRTRVPSPPRRSYYSPSSRYSHYEN